MTSTGTHAGKAAVAGSLISIAIGLGALVSSNFFGISARSGVMNPITAIAFILSGVSLALALIAAGTEDKKSRAPILSARLCALMVALFGVFELMMGGHGVPNYTAPLASLNFMLLGVALLLSESNNHFIRSLLRFFISIVGLGSLGTVLGCAYHVNALYGFDRFNPMPLTTAVAFLVMTGAVFLVHSDKGLLAVFVGKSSAGITARRLLPAVILIPAAFGWLELRAEQRGILGNEFGNALVAVADILVLVLLVSWSVWSISRLDLEREKSAKILERQTALLNAQLNSSIDGILMVDQKNGKILQNHRMKDLFKIPPHIAEDKNDESQLQWVTGMVKNSGAFLEKIQYLNAHPDEVSLDEIELNNGITVECYSARVEGNDGAYYGRIWTFRDITQRKKAEESLYLLNSAVLQSEEAMLITDAGLNLPGPQIIFVNHAFTAMTGYTAEEVIGQTPRILQGPRTDRGVLDRLRKNLEQGEKFEGETINYRKDGTEFDLEWKIAPIRLPTGEITHFVAIQRNITERKRTEARFRRLVESNVQGVIFWTRDGKITDANDAFLQLVGYTREDLDAGIVDWVALTPPEYAELDVQALKEIDLKGASTPYEKEFIRKDGARVPILLGAAAFEDNRDEGVCYTLDLTDRKKLEQQLFQAQKLETVGKLAAGVAHEFNSILTAIIGQSELLLNDLPAESPLLKNASEINVAAARAATLTRQLLAYGRKQILQPEVLDLTRILTGMEGALHHLMGPDVDVRISLSTEVKMVKADAGQIEQVIVNMAINARDAMPNGGKLTLETANVSLDAYAVSHYPELKPGEYVMVAITDTGTGMRVATRARVFEPFFSTKDVGDGAGLGLSTCYGIVKQSGGHISVYSEVGVGTTFKIYLPQVNELAKPPISSLNSGILSCGTETILLVEDDPALREMAAELLERLGYEILIAANGVEALKHQQPLELGLVDLLFTDVVMPHMSGKELSERVRALSPHTKILFSSAYTENAIVHQGILDAGVMLLQKPFAPSALAKKVREILDQAPVASL